MESFAYVLILTLAIATLTFAIAFRAPPKNGNSPLDPKKDPVSLQAKGFWASIVETDDQAALLKIQINV